jgi:hypothetical protein
MPHPEGGSSPVIAMDRLEAPPAHERRDADALPHLVPAWLLIGGLFVLATALAYAGGGKVVSFAFVAAALALGLTFRRSRPIAYLCLCWWLWLLTPELRRIIDWRSTWSPADPVMLAPGLTTSLTLLTVLGRLRDMRRRWFGPYLLAMAGLFLGYLVGVARVGVASATYGMFDWAVPVMLAAHIALEWRHAPEVRRALDRLIDPTVMLLSAYAIIQFALLPSWDRFWIRAADINSVGPPIAGKFRAFSTLNAPQPFACVLVTLLLLLMGSRSRWRPIVYAVGGTALGLSLVRSAWLGWVIGLLAGLVLPRLQAKHPPKKVVALIVIVAVVVILGATTGGMPRVISKRLDSLAHLSHDDSYETRIKIYEGTTATALQQPFGQGIGSTGTATKLATSDDSLGRNGNFDSGVLEIPLVLGWLGAALYVSGILWLVGRSFHRRSRQRYDLVARAVALASLSQMVGFDVLKTVIGLFALIPVAVADASRHYAAEGADDGDRPPRHHHREPVL